MTSSPLKVDERPAQVDAAPPPGPRSWTALDEAALAAFAYTPPPRPAPRLVRERLVRRFASTIPTRRLVKVTHYDPLFTRVVTSVGCPAAVRGELIYLEIGPSKKLAIPAACLVTIVSAARWSPV